MLIRRLISLLLLISCSLAADDWPPKRGQKENVRFPVFGEVLVEGVVRPHTLPEVTFTSASGKVLLRIQLGSGFLDPEYINPGGKMADPYPIVRLAKLTLPQFSGPLILAATMEGGGSDCSYTGALVGEIDGKLSSLLPRLPMVNTEGGYAIGELEKGSGLQFAAWNMIWRKTEAHVDPHDQWVQIYRYDPAKGKFALVRRYVVRKSQGEVDFPNLLRQLRDFSC